VFGSLGIRIFKLHLQIIFKIHLVALLV